MTRPKVFFYVQHLLGIGHLVRATRVARALAREAFDVDLVVGGTPVPGLDAGGAQLVHLPPMRAAANFGDLLDDEGRALGDDAKATRRDRLLAAFDAAQPDILLIEAFPFGRTQMRFELLPLLERAQARPRRPLVGVSIRDILQRGRKLQRLEETATIVERWVDVVLVHGDPALLRLEATFPLTHRIEDRIVYTGIVGPQVGAPAASAGAHQVIVSAGGGAVGERLIRAALEAKARTSLRDAKWLVVTGPNFPSLSAAERATLIGANASVDWADFVADLPGRLHHATLSISQAGYNTVADLLAARCRAVVVPYAAYGESEQTDRARILEANGLATVVNDAELDAPRLADAIERALALPKLAAVWSLRGAQETAAILSQRVRGRHT